MNTTFRSQTATKRQSSIAFPGLQSIKILDQVRERIRYLHYSIRTEESYLYWIRFFIRWSGVRHPREMGADEVRAFLTFLASPAIGAHRSQRREAVLRETPRLPSAADGNSIPPVFDQQIRMPPDEAGWHSYLLVEPAGIEPASASLLQADLHT